MTREEYFDKIELSLSEIQADATFNSYLSQMFAWKTGARFTKSYDEDFIWKRALYLSSNACKLLKKHNNSKVALQALKLSAEIYEYLSEISEIFDRDFCYVLSALCFDISGYQANALCMIRNLVRKNGGLFYQVVQGESYINTELKDENYILVHIQHILLKQIPFIYSQSKRSSLNFERSEDWLGIKLFDEAVYGLYKHILKGTENTFSVDIYESYNYYLKQGNVFVSHLLQLLSSRFDRYNERSIWNKLRPIDPNPNGIWLKYIRLLTNDIYDKNSVKNVKNRRSIFEFWISQLNAIDQGVLETNESFIIQMPTSAGKTFIAELSILKNLISYPDKKCFYIAPFRALTNEKELELSQNLTKLGFSVSSLSGDYEVDEFQNFILNTTDVLIATPEKLDLLYRLQRDYFEKVSLLVIDEGHIIGDINERAALLEFLIIRLRIKLPELKILFISAVMPPANSVEFSSWLSKKETNIIKSPKYSGEKVWEPTRKLIGKFTWYDNGKAGQITYPFNKYFDYKGEIKEPFVPNYIRLREFGKKFPLKNKGHAAVTLALKLSLSGSTLIFTSRPDWAESTARNFLLLLENLKAQGAYVPTYFEENLSSTSFYVCSKWLGKDNIITKCVKNGIGVHFGDLPETVRKAIEIDFRNGVFRVLVSTNTVGQGINFPIKNIVIHSLDINPEKGIKVSVRDFWNIIGRAGRAGKETEGQIIFIVDSTNDESKFSVYTNENNINKADSIFSLIYKFRIRRNFSQEEFEDWIDYFTESFLMSLLVEELLLTDDELLVEQIIGNSLFKLQVADTTLLKNAMLKTIRNIKNAVPDTNRLHSYAANGFCLKSNLIIEEYIDSHIEIIKELIENDSHLELLKLILILFDNKDIRELQFDAKLASLNGKVSTLNHFINCWINGTEINTLKDVWREYVDANLNEKMFIFFSQGLNYRFPWGITAFLTILTYKFNLTLDNIPPNIKSLSSYLKYGLNNHFACFLISIGIKSRELATLIIDEYKGINNYEYILRWITNINIEETSRWGLDKIESENLIELSQKFNTSKIKEFNEPILFTVKGTYYIDEAKTNSLSVNIGDIITYERDVNNQHDSFAIKLYFNNSFIGYVPREFARPISIEMDVFNAKFTLIVTKIENRKEFNRIFVQASKK